MTLELILLAILLLIFPIGGLIAAPFIIKLLGSWNIFFIPAVQERAVMIDTGEKFSGKVIFSSEELAIGKNYTFVPKGDPKALPDDMTLLGKLILKTTGMRFYGVWPFQKPHFSEEILTHWVTPEGSNERVIETIAIWTPYVLSSLQELAFRVKAAEDADGQPINVEGSFFAQAKEFYTPTYKIKGSYLSQMTAKVTNTIIAYIKTREFVSNTDGDLKTVKKDVIDSKAIKDILDELNKDILATVGFEVKSITIDDVALAGVANDEIVKAQAGVVKAKLDATARVTLAEADKTVRKLQGEGEELYQTSLAKGLASKKGEVSPEVLAQMAIAANFKNVTVLGAMPTVMVPAPEPPPLPQTPPPVPPKKS